jgi:mRNA interferase RelE/StbE
MSSNLSSDAENYKLEIKPSAAKELESLGTKKDREKIVARINRLATDPRPNGSEKLKGEPDTYKVRQGNYRIVYTIDDRKKLVVVGRIADRKEAYR